MPRLAISRWPHRPGGLGALGTAAGVGTAPATATGLALGAQMMWNPTGAGNWGIWNNGVWTPL